MFASTTICTTSQSCSYDRACGLRLLCPPSQCILAKLFYPLLERDSLYWRLQQNYFVSSVHPGLYRMLERTLIPKFATSFPMKRTLRWRPVITSIPFRTITLFKKAKHVGWVFFSRRTFACRGPSFQEVPSWRAGRSRTLTFSCGFSLALWIVFHSTLISSRALNAVSTVAFFLCPWTCPWLQQRQRRAFQIVFHERRIASHEIFVPSAGPPSVQVWCSLAIDLQKWIELF